MSIFAKLQKIDRRILYILIALVITVPLIIRPGKHPEVFEEVEDAYAVIDVAPDDKIVLISAIWGPGTVAENAPQTQVIMRHLFLTNKRFAVIAWDQAGSELTYQIGEKLADELGKEYGVDWVHLGYRVPYLQVVLRGMAENFQGVLQYDRFKTPLSKIPAVDDVKGYRDIGTVVEISPSATVEIWIAYFTGVYDIPLIYCPTAVMAAEAYPFLDSGQIAGMLNGVVGAAQYEKLLGLEGVPTDASATAWALSSAHIFIIVLIVLGNLGYMASRRARRRNGGGTLVD